MSAVDRVRDVLNDHTEVINGVAYVPTLFITDALRPRDEDQPTSSLPVPCPCNGVAHLHRMGTEGCKATGHDLAHIREALARYERQMGRRS